MMVDESEPRKLGNGSLVLDVAMLASPASRILAGHIIFEGITTLPQANLLPNSQFPSCCFIFSCAIHHLILPVLSLV